MSPRLKLCASLVFFTLSLPSPYSRYPFPIYIPFRVIPSQDGPYSWSIVSDPIRAFLFVLVRDADTFFGSQGEADLLAKCKDLGFTAFWNSPHKTKQEGCEYPTTVGEDVAKAVSAAAVSAAEDSVKVAAVAEVDDKLSELSPVLKLRGGGLGVKGPLHASCKVSCA